MVEKRGHDEMTDRKFLFKRGGVWTIRFRLPKKYGGGLFQRSLGTGDITTARKWRDLYVTPFLVGENLFDATQALLDRAFQQGLTQDKRFEQLKRVFTPGEVDGQVELPIQNLVDQYLAHVEKGEITASTRQAYSSILKGFLQIVGPERPAVSITKQDISAYRDKLLALPVNWLRLQKIPPKTEIKKTVSPAQVANSLSYVKGLFSWSLNEEVIEITVNPAQGVKAPFARKKGRRPFTKVEVEEACSLPMPDNTKAFDQETWEALPLLARYTGARLGELAQLAGKNVVEVHGVQCFHIFESEHEEKTTKTHNERFVPIASKIKPLVAQLKEKQGDGLLFPKSGTWRDKTHGVIKPGKVFGNVFQREVKKIASDLTFHCFRNFAVSQMANAGVPEEVRMRIVGHKGRSVHAGYTEIDISVMELAVETIY